MFFPRILSYLRYFFFRKAHNIGIGIIENRADTEIVQAAEDALFGNAQDTGEDGKIQELVPFQSVIVKGTEIGDSRIIEAMVVGILDGRVVLINQDNWSNFIVPVEIFA